MRCEAKWPARLSSSIDDIYQASGWYDGQDVSGGRRRLVASKVVGSSWTDHG